MFKSLEMLLTMKGWVLASLVLCAGQVFAQAAKGYEGIGRFATEKEVAAWNIDVRPDFQGLPTGSGSVAMGQQVWEGKCAMCHGVFGESNEVFSPLIGGTTKDDVRTGRVANLKRTDYPGRTTLMKVATVSTLWDYINRAMPWNAPKSLTSDEVYAVTAYLLNMADVVPESFVLSHQTMPQAQARMPNRNGMTTAHALWPDMSLQGVTRKPDTANTACMKNCAIQVKVTSSLPDHARNNHGNLAIQNRPTGAQQGVDTSRPFQPTMKRSLGAASQAPAASSIKISAAKTAQELMQKNNCLACHGMNQKLVGPGFTEIAAKYKGQTDYLAGKIKSGGSGVWGPVPMPAQTLGRDDVLSIASWLAAGMPK